MRIENLIDAAAASLLVVALGAIASVVARLG
jgi:hypothetical protein